MMLRLKPFVGSSTYQFKDPDTGYVIYGASREDLVKRIFNYRTQNELPPIESLNAVIENYLCGLPENSGKCEPNILHRSFLSYIKGGIVLLQNLFYGEANMVDQATADNRSIQCRGCEFNVFPDKDHFIKWSDDIAERSTGGKRSRYHDDLGSCSVCTCPLRAKVWYKGPFNSTEEERRSFDKVNCWQLKELNKENT